MAGVFPERRARIATESAGFVIIVTPPSDRAGVAIEGAGEMFVRAWNDDLECAAVAGERGLLGENQRDDRRVDDRAPGQVDDHVAAQRRERALDWFPRCGVVFAVEEDGGRPRLVPKSRHDANCGTRRFVGRFVEPRHMQPVPRRFGAKRVRRPRQSGRLMRTVVAATSS
jgi:hypothetical protein